MLVYLLLAPNVRRPSSANSLGASTRRCLHGGGYLPASELLELRLEVGTARRGDGGGERLRGTLVVLEVGARAAVNVGARPLKSDVLALVQVFNSDPLLDSGSPPSAPLI